MGAPSLNPNDRGSAGPVRPAAKREAGAAVVAKAGAAPATVSGEPLSNKVTEACKGFGKAGQQH